MNPTTIKNRRIGAHKGIAGTVLLAILVAHSALSAGGEALTPAALESSPALHPAQVTVSIPIEAPIVLNGREAGEIKLPAGRSFPVKNIANGLVTVEVGPGAIIDVPLADTDALARAGQLAAERAAAQAAAAASPTPTPTPTPAATPTATPPPPPPPITNAFAKRLTGDLVKLDGRRLDPFDHNTLVTKKFIALYYSAIWCGPCREFTPDLVSFYRRKKADLDKFDVLFVSSDRSADEMLEYMIEDRMPWPAVAYARLKTRHPVHDFSGRSIPRLIILDESGNPLPELNVGEDYIGARASLKVLEKRLRDL